MMPVPVTAFASFAIRRSTISRMAGVGVRLIQDKTALLDEFDVGAQVRVHFNLRGREYTRKSDGATDYWTNLECWRIEKADRSRSGLIRRGRPIMNLEPVRSNPATTKFRSDTVFSGTDVDSVIGSVA